MKLALRLLLIALAGAASMVGQTTKVDLRHQISNVDFTEMPWTKPVKLGVSLPATCSVGELFFRTSGDGGLVLHACTSPNTWTNPAACPDCVRTSESYSNPSWLTSVDWSAVSNKPAAYPALGHTHTAGEISGGVLADSRISQSSVKQHEGALTIGLSQISGSASGDVTGSLGSLNVERIRGNPVAAGTPLTDGEFYAWDALNGRFSLYTLGSMLTVSGGFIDVATESVPQYLKGTVVPGACTRYGLLFWDTDAPAGMKLYYCNGSTYEAIVSGGTGNVSGPVSAVDSEVALFDGTDGKTLKRASATGVAKLTSGVLGVVSGSATECVKVDGSSGPCGGGTALTEANTYVLPWGGSGSTTNAAVFSPGAVRGWVYIPPVSVTVSNIAFRIGIAGTNGNAFAWGIYNADGTVKLTTCSGTTLSTTGKLHTCNPVVTLNAGSVYRIVASTEDTTVQYNAHSSGCGSTLLDILNQGGRVIAFTSSQTSTGSGAGYTLPSTLGTMTASGTHCFPFIALLP